MKFHRPLPSLFLLAAAALLLTASQTWAENDPVWSFTVPASTLASDASGVSSITTDVAGNTLVIIQHSTTVMFVPFPVGSQILLLDNRGRLVGAGDFATFINATSIFVSAKKAIIAVGTLQELTIGPNKTLVANPVPLQGASENVANVPDAKAIDRKFVHSSESTSGKVSAIHCYVLKKLKSVPGCHCTEEED